MILFLYFDFYGFFMTSILFCRFILFSTFKHDHKMNNFIYHTSFKKIISSLATFTNDNISLIYQEPSSHLRSKGFDILFICT